MNKSGAPLVKICGITRPEDALHALDSGADFFGMVFYSKSPRAVTASLAAEIMDRLRREGYESPPAIGVFVNEDATTVARLAEELGLWAVQIHGDETPEYCASLPGRVIRGFRVRDESVLRDMASWPVWACLCDAWDPRAYGGTGKMVDLEILAPYVSRHRIILAGGLEPGNISATLRRITPFAVDVSSGVESSPGIKDPVKVREFVRGVKQPG